ncbi:hypothetical protein KDA_52900 [Dictyobacter alpinus]|uniref:Uncharacterized protein n=1 Tax=Dictyobacter alpinus TaxID=2014873 RepID=A0A402BES6_9CHLR|nr:hypothetical protein KDA_52900 [Dictyobacter alpinus]
MIYTPYQSITILKPEHGVETSLSQHVLDGNVTPIENRSKGINKL